MTTTAQDSIECVGSSSRSMSQLQAQLRSFFRDEAPARALLKSLIGIGEYLGGDYLAVHARLGVHFLSEEFSEGFDPSDQLRDFINTAMSDAMESGQAGCVRLSAGPGEEHGPAVIAALLYDEAGEQAGAAAILLRSCSRERAMETLASFESTLGFLSLLLGWPQPGAGSNSSAETSVLADVPADDPSGLAFHAAAQLCNCHDLDQVAVGYVRGKRVFVAAICGLDEVRSANPGVKSIARAMEECLDIAEPILHHGPLDEQEIQAFDHPLHRQWSQSAGGDTVGTFPLQAGTRVVAIVAVRKAPGSGIQVRNLKEFQIELGAYGRLLPLADRASRSVVRHLRDVLGHELSRFLGRTRRRLLFSLTATFAGLLWLVFGSLPYSITVPAEIAATDSRVLVAPRAGTLRRVHVQPGDAVRVGQVLAELDAHELELQRAELSARLASLAVEADQALVEGTPVERRVIGSRHRALLAEMATVEHRIAQSAIRATTAGVVLDGDLQGRLGAVIPEGELLFEIADLGDVRVIAKIAESSVLMAREHAGATFSPAAEPHLQHPIEDLRIPPAATVEGRANVFRAMARMSNADGRMSPGIEGVVQLDLGTRNAFWVLTHRITDWLQWNFWM